MRSVGGLVGKRRFCDPVGHGPVDHINRAWKLIAKITRQPQRKTVWKNLREMCREEKEMEKPFRMTEKWKNT